LPGGGPDRSRGCKRVLRYGPNLAVHIEIADYHLVIQRLRSGVRTKLMATSGNQRRLVPIDGALSPCIAATRSLEPDPQRVTALIACWNGTSKGCTRSALSM